MGFLKSGDQKAAAKESLRARIAARAERDRNPVTRWEYRVARIGAEKQKGLLGSRRMEEIMNKLGSEGWELVTLNMERATFKRQVPHMAAEELAEYAAEPEPASE